MLAAPTAEGQTLRTSCQHCGYRKVNRPRGLCAQCYYDFQVRIKYQLANGRTHPPRQYREKSTRPTPRQPTTALPGTIEKMHVLRDRWSYGFQLHHPDDAK